MIRPAQFDARKALAEAISDLRTVGAVLTVFGLGPLVAAAFSRGFERIVFLSVGAVVFSPGVLVLIVCSSLQKRHAWAARAAMILHSASAAVFALLLIVSLFGLPYTLGILVAMGAWLAAALILLRQLRLGLQAVHYLSESEHGFTPVIAHAVDDPPTREDT